MPLCESIEKTYGYFRQRIDEIEENLWQGSADPARLITELEILTGELRGTSFTDLLTKSRILLSLARERIEPAGSDESLKMLDRRLEVEEATLRRKGRIRTARIVTLTTGIVSLGLFTASWLVSDLLFNRYSETSSEEEAQQLLDTILVFDTLTIIFGSLGVLSLGVSVPLYAAEANY
jgi:hypothetical protein